MWDIVTTTIPMDTVTIMMDHTTVATLITAIIITAVIMIMILTEMTGKMMHCERDRSEQALPGEEERMWHLRSRKGETHERK